MKPNRYMLMLAVLLLASGGSGLRAGDSAGDKAVTASFTDTSDVSDYYSKQDNQSADVAPQPADAKAEPAETPEAPAAVSRTDTTPIWMNNPSIAWEPLPDNNWLATRFGWWAVATNGSKAMVGEWQGLEESAPFFDVDGLTSDGYRTANFWVSGPESEATMAGLEYYNGPGLSFDVDYRRFLHRLGVKPIGGQRLLNSTPPGMPPEGGFFFPPLFSPTPGYVMFGSNYPAGNSGVVGSDLINAGDDYAIRVQQFDADVKGNITENLSWRIGFWGMKKEGTRQANTTQHCSNYAVFGAGSRCHVMTQGQSIDWLTAQVEPGIAWQTDSFSLEYSRTMRSFQQDDEAVLGFYQRNPPYGFGPGFDGYNNWATENYTEIDRVKVWSQVAQDTDMYVLGWVGNTHNKLRESDRKFYGVDGRITNQSIDGLNLVGYAKAKTQNNSADTRSLNSQYPGDPHFLEAVPPQQMYTPNNYLGLVDRDSTAVGVKSRWRPFYDSCGIAQGFAMVGGYEWAEVQRTNVTYNLDNLVPFTQPTTVSNMVFVGVQEDWSPALSSFLRYRLTANSWPIVGVTEREQLSLDAAINSNQPEHVGQVEMGGTWNVADDFMINGTFWIENSYNHSEFVDFSETAYPYTISAWYTPSACWSFVAGYASLTNWITQDITLGRENGLTSAGVPDPTELVAWTSPWNFAGKSNVVNLAASYAASETLRLMSQLEYVRAENFYETPPSPATATTPYTDLPGYSAVVSDIYRVTAGFDYLIRPRIDAFFRYNFYDYIGDTQAYNSGVAHMFLGGVSGTF